ncbi:MAG: transposase [Balneolaceae bacterium]|nr:transposase [Balneolaceae bacterium]
MGRTRYRIHETEYPYFITSSIVRGYPVFSNILAANIILDSLTFLQNQRDTKLYAYVIMENHLHMIVQSDKLPKHLRSFKSWTARAIIDQFEQQGHTRLLHKLRMAKKPSHTDSQYQVWQEGCHPKQILWNNMMIQKIEYIHNNPVKRGFVDKPEDWRYTSARNYLGMKGLVEVSLFHF